MRLKDHLDSMQEVNEGGASIHTNKDIEDKLRKVGFDIPPYPKQGTVTLNGKEVGRMDNFNGLTINSKSALQLIKKTIPKIGIWNPNKAVNEDELSELNKKSFEGQIRKAKKDKNRLKNLKSTIQSMADGMMLSKKDASDLMNSINKLI